VCANLEEFGIKLDSTANLSPKGEAKISAEDSRTQIWVVPTNEEIVVARQTKALLEQRV
jgi:acetate kinase